MIFLDVVHKILRTHSSLSENRSNVLDKINYARHNIKRKLDRIPDPPESLELENLEIQLDAELDEAFAELENWQVNNLSDLLKDDSSL